MPEKVQELSIDGIYALIGYWISSFNYLALTGDIEPLKKTDPSSEYYKELEPMVKLYETGRGWIYDTSEPMSVYLLTDTPTQVEGDRIRYFWRARSLVGQNAKRHLTEGDNRDKSLARAEDSQGQTMRIVVEYKEGAWFMSTQKDRDADKSTESANPSAS
jgi:acyl-coA dehydrogenase